VWAVKKFRPYIYGRHVKIVTDHKALEFLTRAKDSTGQLYRWSNKLQEYDYTVAYREGTVNVNADVLSRTPWNPPEEDTFF